LRSGGKGEKEVSSLLKRELGKEGERQDFAGGGGGGSHLFFVRGGGGTVRSCSKKEILRLKEDILTIRESLEKLGTILQKIPRLPGVEKVLHKGFAKKISGKKKPPC